MNLSRKHAIEVDEQHRVIGIFGGKLTDCLNVGREVLDELKKWLPEVKTKNTLLFESQKEKAGFMQAAQGLGLAKEAAERLWRRFDLEAYQILKQWEQNDRLRETILSKAAYSRAELEYMAKHEMITSLDDFFRRRTGLAMAYSKNELLIDPGLEELASILFGEDGKKAIEIFKE